MSKRRAPLFVLSAALSVLLLIALFRRIDPGDYGRMLASVHLPSLLAYMAVNLAGAALRAWRYRILLRPVPVGWGEILTATLVRNAFVDLLPARIGALSYVYVLNDRLEKPFGDTASSFAVSFVFDFLTLAPFVLLAAWIVGFSAAGIPAAALIAAAAAFFIISALVAWKIAVLVRLGAGLLRSGMKKTAAARRPSVIRAFENLDRAAEALEKTRKRGAYPSVFLLSLLIRLAKYGSLFFLFFAVLRSQGISWEGMSFWKTVLGLTGAELTSALPVKGLAGFGTWESAWAAALQWMKFDPRLAVLSGLGIHLITNLFEYGLGLSALGHLAFRRKRDKIARIP
ncbi:MAG: flippase-like domain-containing protein [Candidatus Aminicenantes bacterium]|nr:flippase-like domain-containing protein [Candidatus Aminicenantes bacterium]